jgi:uncharacterized phage-associated protein
MGQSVTSARETEWAPTAGFDEKKSAQMVGYFAQLASRAIGKMKLIKLVYLSEREYLNRYLLPMTLDEFYSMKDGPVASATLNGINGRLNKSLWAKWIKVDGRQVTAARARKRGEFDQLSNADIRVLDAVWAKFGKLSDHQIWEYVHSKENVPEYTKVDSGRVQIRYSDILAALDKDSAAEIAEEIQIMQREAALL